MRACIIVLVATLLAGCIPAYKLVKPEPVPVAAGAMKVRPSIAWNKAPKAFTDIPAEETWTQNGPALDAISFIGGLPDGQAIAKQKPKDDRKVPVFRASMTPQDLVSMIESYYRIKVGATIFAATDVQPTTFLGKQGIQISYDYVLRDEVKRRGRTLLAVAEGKLYVMSLVGASTHYFDAALPEFEKLAASASIG
jgi:hypothetical protein